MSLRDHSIQTSCAERATNRLTHHGSVPTNFLVNRSQYRWEEARETCRKEEMALGKAHGKGDAGKGGMYGKGGTAGKGKGAYSIEQVTN